MTTRKPITILFVDDDPNARKLYGTALGALGFSVLYAADCIETRDLLKRITPAFIIYDIVMDDPAGIDGIACADQVKNSADGKSIPFIFLSNIGDSSDDLEMVKKEIGALDLIHKSIGPAAFADRIKEIVSRI